MNLPNSQFVLVVDRLTEEEYEYDEDTYFNLRTDAGAKAILMSKTDVELEGW